MRHLREGSCKAPPKIGSSAPSREAYKYPVIPDPHIRVMALTRLFSALAEITGAALIARSRSLEQAVAVNAVLGTIGPLVLTFTTVVGLWGLAERLPWPRLAAVLTGLGLILWGIKK